MPQLKVEAESFNLLSSWTVTTGSNGTLYISSGPTTDSRPVTFTYELPDDITVTSAKVHSEWGSPLSGFDTHTVNGTTPNDEGFVDVVIDPEATSIDVTFVFKAMGNTTSQGNRQAATEIIDIYLLIEYEHNYIPPELLAYTDPTLTQGVTYVKAVHMTELHTNVNRVRVAYKLSEYVFTTITSGTTGLGGWNNHVLEIRTALDEIGKTHDAWITLGANCPRADVLMQLRNVVQTIAQG